MNNKLIYGIIGVLVMGVLAFYLMNLDGGIELTGETKSFEITAKNWEFDPGIIEVNAGDNVKIKLTSVDVAHGIRISAFGINQRVEAGETVEFEFIADQAGEFDFFCNVYCGLGHRDMTGKLIVK